MFLSQRLIKSAGGMDGPCCWRGDPERPDHRGPFLVCHGTGLQFHLLGSRKLLQSSVQGSDEQVFLSRDGWFRCKEGLVRRPWRQQGGRQGEAAVVVSQGQKCGSE